MTPIPHFYISFTVMKKHFPFFKLIIGIIVCLIFLGNPNIARSGKKPHDEIPTRYGLSAVLGRTFDPVNDISFVQVSGFIMWDYERVWRHRASDSLRFKVETTAGTTTSPEIRAIVAVDMMALYYLEPFPHPKIHPFIEGGVGLIYTDFQVEGQGLRFNANPQIGIGTEFYVDSTPPFFMTIRLQHISNGGLHKNNRGVNSFVLMIGRFF